MSFSFQLKAKKTPFQKEEEEAAKVFEDFVKDFGGEDDELTPFVSGGVIQTGESVKELPGEGPPSFRRHYAGSSSFQPVLASAQNIKDSDEPSVFAAKGKPRSIDLLLKDLKKDQAERQQRRDLGLALPEEVHNDHASLEQSDQGSTNLFVGNIAPHVDESMLLHEFGRFGPIGSVKIMWPRDEEQRRRGKNTGFVAFMRREDAERAKDALDGITLHDLTLMVGWSKAVPLPAVPVWPLPGNAEAGATVAAPAAPESTRQRMHDGPPPKEIVRGYGSDIVISIPEDARQRFVIDAMAYYVMRDGCEFEQVVMQREHENPEFAFLFDVRSPEHTYYRWRVFSLANGDTLRSWRVDPFLMTEGSNRWTPPPMSAIAAAQKSAAQGLDRRDDSTMPEKQREKLSNMLRGLTVERAAIRDAMAFALDHAESAADVSALLIDSLTSAQSPTPLKVARLFLLSDILHNTSASVRNASRFRALLQDALPDVFESLQEAYRHAGGRMAQEHLRKHVLKVLRVWRGWYIFSDDFLNGLQVTFLRGGTGPSGSATASAGATNSALEAVLEGLTDEEIDTRCRNSGLSRKGGRDVQITRLLALDIYLNGQHVAAAPQQEVIPPQPDQETPLFKRAKKNK